MGSASSTRRELLGIGGIIPFALATGLTVKLDDFLDNDARAAAQDGRVVDCTAAIGRALATGRRVSIGPGRYGVRGLQLPNGGGLIGEPGAILHQIDARAPVLDIVSNTKSGQLADLIVQGLTLVGHSRAQSTLVRMEALGSFAIWRSQFEFFAKDAFRALEIVDGSNVFECAFQVVAEGNSDVAVQTAGVYNRYHLFLSRTRTWALDDRSNASDIRVVSENALMLRGQMNRIYACVEGISHTRAADPAAIVDRGFGNTFLNAIVNMPVTDAGKLEFAFRTFDRSVFVNPQIIGPGVPPHPFAPSSYSFTIIGGRSNARHSIDATYDGSAPDRDPRRITFVGDVRDFTRLPTGAGTRVVQRFVPTDGASLRIAPATQIVLLDAPRPMAAVRLDLGALPPPDGWQLSIRSTHPITRIHWPPGGRFARLEQAIAAGSRFDLIYSGEADAWFPL